MRTPLLLLSLILVPSLAAAQTTAWVGARVFDGTGRVIERATIVVTDGRVTALAAVGEVTVPPGAVRVDVTGRTIVPGLINAHGHVGNTVGLASDPNGYTRENLLRQLRTYAQYGVTTVFSLGDDQAAGFALRDEQGRGDLDRARLFVAGPVITGASADAARAMTDTVADMKPDLLKIRIDDNLGTAKKMPEEAWRAVFARARERGLRVATHIFYLADAQAALDAGSDFVAHSVRDVPVSPAFVQAMKAKRACYSPTFTRELSTFVYGDTPTWVNDPFFTRAVDASIVAQLSDPKRQADVRASVGYKLGQQYKAALETAKRNLKTLADAGVRIAFGTDTGPPGRFQGFFEHLEMEMMVEAGLTPMQALMSATGDAARCHGKAGQLGSLEPGAAADLIVLGANPLEDIRNLRRIEGIYIGGRRLP